MYNGVTSVTIEDIVDDVPKAAMKSGSIFGVGWNWCTDQLCI